MILLLMSLAFANEPQFTNLNKGEKAPFDGRLFNGAAVSKLITENQYKDLECEVKVEYELNKTLVKKQYEFDIMKAELVSRNEMLKEINEIRNDEIEELRKSYKPAKPYLWLTGGFILGSAASIAIFHTVK